jgi:hypothetical protein
MIAPLRGRMIVLLAGVALALVVAGPPAGGGTVAVRDLDREIAAAAKRLLANPADAEATATLTDLRRQQKDARAKALDALARGLAAFRDGRMAAAAPDLKTALECPGVVAMANAVLLKPLESYAKASAQPAPAPAAAPAPCTLCGGVGYADCSDAQCQGGVKVCSQCAGKGQVPDTRRRPGVVASSPMMTCPTCGGSGGVECKVCSGKGVVPCPRCSGTAVTPTAAPGLGSTEIAAINEVIDKATYLRAGGADLWSPAGLRPSPRAGP